MNTKESKIIWKGKPSQILYLHKHIFLLAIIVLINYFSDILNTLVQFSVYKYIFTLTIIILARMSYFVLKLYCTKYIIYESKIGIKRGILNLKYDETELYRIKDYSLNAPFLLRIFKLSNLLMVSSDRIFPVILFKAIPDGMKLFREIEKKVEKERKEKRVYEID